MDWSFSELRAAFVAPSDAWWAGAAAVAVVLAILTAWSVAHWPRWLPAPLTDLERRAAKRPAAVRLLVSAAVPLAGAVATAGLVALVFTPRRPCALVLSERTLPEDPRAWDAVPAEFSRVDAGPVVDRVLAAAEQAGAEKWVAATPDEREQLHKLCLAELREYAAGRRGPDTRPEKPLPAWVRSSAEMTVFAALARCLENPAAASVRAARGRPGEGWERAAPLVVRAGMPDPLLPVDEPPRSAVRFMLDGRAVQQNGRVQFRVAVETPVGTPVTPVPVEVADPATGRREVLTVTAPATGWQVVTVDAAVTGFTSSAALIATAEGGAVRTPLPLTVGPGWVSNLVAAVPDAAAFDKLDTLWKAVLGPPPSATQPPTNPLRSNSMARGWQVPELLNGADVARPTVHVRGDELIVTAPGLDPDTIPPGVLTSALDLATLPPPDAAVHGDRVSKVSGPASVDSWMSVGVGLPDPANTLPTAATGMDPLASGFRLGSKLEDGRVKLARAAERSVAELGRVNGKPFVRVRLNPDREAVWVGSPGQSHAKARAFVATLVWACNVVIGSAPPARLADARRADDPEPTPLLTVADEEELRDLGRRPTDGWAVAALALFLGTVTASAWIWSRKSHPENST